jgi:hypothetical protein
VDESVRLPHALLLRGGWSMKRQQDEHREEPGARP